MKLRVILITLSLIAVTSASLGGYVYYRSLKASAFNEARRQANTRVEIIRKSLSTYLAENIKPARALAGMREVRAFFVEGTGQSRQNVEFLLDYFKSAFQVDVCYLMDLNGVTLATSNRHDPDSFEGRNFSFRPYYKKAATGTPARYMALGTTSRKRGAYYSHPVYAEEDSAAPIGIAVIKASIDQIEKKLGPKSDEIIMGIDKNGVIFISTREEWRFQSLWRLNEEQKTSLLNSRQFGEEPVGWTGFYLPDDPDLTLAVRKDGSKYLYAQAPLDAFPGWRVIYLRNQTDINRVVSEPFFRTTGPMVVLFCLMVGIFVFALYELASREISRRRAIEEALRESEERYRAIYHKTPAMLHSIDPDGRLVRVSDHWLEALGYSREEVIGRKLTDFFSENAKIHAEKEVIPGFFKTGECKDVSYQFVKKDGSRMDVLLSAIGDRDKSGNVVRSLAVSMDVTERYRAERARHQLRRLSGSIMADQEKERAAIARELHDELGQVLTALRMDAVWIHEHLKERDKKAGHRALTMMKLVDKTIEEVRSLAIRLRPTVLDDLGLVDALQWYAGDFERRTEITCVFESEDIPVTGNDLATAAYRVAQEALTNVARHAGASCVTVTLGVEKGWMHLFVIDDGKGFSITDIAEFEGLGLAGMRERAALVGGWLTIGTDAGGNGCQVHFSAPLNGGHLE